MEKNNNIPSFIYVTFLASLILIMIHEKRVSELEDHITYLTDQNEIRARQVLELTEQVMEGAKISRKIVSEIKKDCR